jgi:hypothetical protein
MNHFATTMLAFGTMLAALPAARADTNCTSILVNTTVNGNLIVPAGQGCQMTGVTVTGNVLVQSNATLVFPQPLPASTIVGNVSVGTGASVDVPNGNLTIDGNLGANQCLSVGLNGENVAVGGNVQIQYCTEISVVAVIGGNVGCNNSGTCELQTSKVKGNVQINDNSSAQVFNNTIGNNLQCQGNATISGGGNSVGGKKTGQCAGF